jgi:hypothetical protein
VLQHHRQRRLVFLDVEVLDVAMPPLVIVTGGLRVGSTILAENLHHDAILPACR